MYRWLSIRTVGRSVYMGGWQLLFSWSPQDDSQAVFRCLSINPQYIQFVEKGRNENAKLWIKTHLRQYINIRIIMYYEQNNEFVRNSSHCPDSSCTLCSFANCSAKSPFPVCFTACTTVFHVRGRSPVPSLRYSHFSTRSNMQESTFDLSLPIPSMMAGFT